MGESKCYVFVDDGVVVIKSNGKIVLPKELSGYPIIINNENGTKVIISRLIYNPITWGLMRSCILDTIKLYRSDKSVPRLEFPCWNEMIIYPVAIEHAEEEYWCPEQVVDSFLDLSGPEFVI